jgi:hypothetical protein
MAVYDHKVSSIDCKYKFYFVFVDPIAIGMVFMVILVFVVQQQQQPYLINNNALII